MKIWTSEHVFNHNWETITQGQWRKYPNPHNTAVLGTDVLDRRVVNGVLHSHRLIQSDWALADWVQMLIGTNQVCFATETSTVDPRRKVMEMRSTNLTFCNFIAMDEKMVYSQHPDHPAKTLLKQEMVVTVRGVPLTSYMESIVVNTVSKNANKGRDAMNWVVDKLGQECRALNLPISLEKLKSEILELRSSVAESLIQPAKKSIEELQRDLQKVAIKAQPQMLRAEESIASQSKSL